IGQKAKLILKTLFLLSLDGRGSTVNEIASSALVFETSDGDKTIPQVEALLRAFVQACPDKIVIRSTKGSTPVYSIRLRSDELGGVLESGLKDLPVEMADVVFL